MNNPQLIGFGYAKRTAMKHRIDSDKAADALAASNGRLQWGCTSAETLQYLADWADKQMAVLPQSLQRGALIRHHWAGPTANSYNYSKTVTGVTLQRGAGAWSLVDTWRIEVRPKQAGTQTLDLLPEHRSEAAHRLLLDMCGERWDKWSVAPWDQK